jgi:hypothetical protein
MAGYSLDRMRAGALHIVLCWCFGCGVLAAAGVGDALPWRVASDVEAGFAFRIPADWQQEDPSVWAFRRPSDSSPTTTKRIVQVDGKRVKLDVAAEVPPIDLLGFSILADDLPKDLPNRTLASIGEYVARDARLGLPSTYAFTWNGLPYAMVDPARPHADPECAPKGVTASIGVGPLACAIVLRYGRRYSGIVVRGTKDEVSVRRILASAEIIAGSGKHTWAEERCADGRVMTSDGNMVKDADAPPVTWDHPLVLETAHLQVISAAPVATIRKWAERTEVLFSALADAFGDDGGRAVKIQLVLLGDQREFLQFCAPMKMRLSENVGGFFVPQRQMVVAFLDLAGAGFPAHVHLDTILAHECAHAFVHRACGGSNHIPEWFNEGIAVYFENGDLTGGRKPRYQPKLPSERLRPLLQGYIKNGTPMHPLASYLTRAGGLDEREYAEAFAMVHFLMHGVPGGRERLRAFWDAVRSGEDGAEAFERCVLADMIAAKGNREAALATWEQAHVAHAIAELNVKP